MYATLEKIRDLLKEKLEGKVKEFWIDDPNLIPVDSLPCIAVAPVSTDIDVADTGRDLFTFGIDVYLIMNAKEELQKYKKEMVGTQFLTKLMEEKDENGNLKSDSIVHILRKNLNLGSNWYISNVGKVEYGIRPRPEQVITKEARYRIEVSRFITRPQ